MPVRAAAQGGLMQFQAGKKVDLTDATIRKLKSLLASGELTRNTLSTELKRAKLIGLNTPNQLVALLRDAGESKLADDIQEDVLGEITDRENAEIDAAIDAQKKDDSPTTTPTTSMAQADLRNVLSDVKPAGQAETDRFQTEIDEFKQTGRYRGQTVPNLTSKQRNAMSDREIAEIMADMRGEPSADTIRAPQQRKELPFPTGTLGTTDDFKFPSNEQISQMAPSSQGLFRAAQGIGKGAQLAGQGLGNIIQSRAGIQQPVTQQQQQQQPVVQQQQQQQPVVQQQQQQQPVVQQQQQQQQVQQAQPSKGNVPTDPRLMMQGVKGAKDASAGPTGDAVKALTQAGTGTGVDSSFVPAQPEFTDEGVMRNRGMQDAAALGLGKYTAKSKDASGKEIPASFSPAYITDKVRQRAKQDGISLQQAAGVIEKERLDKDLGRSELGKMYDRQAERRMAMYGDPLNPTAEQLAAEDRAADSAFFQNVGSYGFSQAEAAKNKVRAANRARQEGIFEAGEKAEREKFAKDFERGKVSNEAYTREKDRFVTQATALMETLSNFTLQDRKEAAERADRQFQQNKLIVSEAIERYKADITANVSKEQAQATLVSAMADVTTSLEETYKMLMRGKKGKELEDLQDAKRNDLAFQLAPILMQFDESKRSELEDLYGINKTATATPPPLNNPNVQGIAGNLLGGTP